MVRWMACLTANSRTTSLSPAVKVPEASSAMDPQYVAKRHEVHFRGPQGHLAISVLLFQYGRQVHQSSSSTLGLGGGD
jgi:hypothetical protein